MTGSLTQPDASRASLDGVGWGPWQGRWHSAVRLEGGFDAWRLLEGEREIGAWRTLQEALIALWCRRSVRGAAPWFVGWLGYAACAELAGGLPTRRDDDDVPWGVLLLEPVQGGAEPVLKPGRSAAAAALVSTLNDGEYARRVEAVRREIEAGNVYQVNLCRRFSVSPWQGGAEGLFENARGGVEPDYLSSMRWEGESSGELVCGSMEMLLRRRGGHVETRPIKGTRRRGACAGEDAELIRDLENDPKELAELAMIVDLERNDLGRVAVPGSVRVADRGSVHTWENIHHRVARVEAKLDESSSLLDLVQAMIPGGSVTGCPKRAAMGTIVDLEPAPRGPFTGALGVVAGNGDLELALPIRTCWTVAGRLEMASGCGIVWQSNPELEAAESRLKLARWIDLLSREGE